jgi:hypothetical protein
MGLEILALAFSVLALGASIATAAYLLFGPTATNLAGRVTALDSDLSDLADRVNQWMRRDSTRRAREAKSELNAPPMMAVPNTGDKKAQLRQRFMSLRGGRSE